MDKRRLNELLVSIRDGNEVAFEELYNFSNKSVFMFVYSFVKSKEAAEDITQEAFIKIKKFIQSYRPNTNGSAWMLQIAKNLALDYIKKYKNETNIDLAGYDLPNKQSSSPELGLILHDLMNRYLTIEERQIVLLHEVHGYKSREIAKFLNMPLGTVLWKYNKAIKCLKNKYKEGQNAK